MSLNSTAALADWLEMLDRIDESVGAALVDADRRVEAAEAAEHPNREARQRIGIALYRLARTRRQG